MAVLVLSLIVVAFSVYCYVVDHISKKRMYELKKIIPGPKPYPLLGNTPLFFMKNSVEVFNILVDCHKKYDRYFSMWNDGTAFVFIYEPDDLQAMLTDNDNIRKSNLYRFAIPWIGEGLLTSTGNKWKKHRRIITPTFFFKILDDYLITFHKNDDIFIEQLAAEVGKGPFNIYPYVNRYAFDNICETAMGVDFEVQKTRDSLYAKAIRDISQTVSLRAFEIQHMIDFIFFNSTNGRIQKKAIQISHDKALDIIKSKRAELEKRAQAGESDGENVGKKAMKSFVELLLESAGSELTNEEIMDEINTFLFEGHDTVSALLSYSLHALGQHLDIQDRVYEEQMRVMSDPDQPATMKDLNAMNYLEQVTKEAARLFPSVSLTGRALDRDLQLPNGPVLPAGTNVAFLVYAIHRNPKIWKNPEEFNPENFSANAAASRHPFAYIPFSAGPRNCIGQKFAKLEIKSAISRIVRKYRILPSDDPAHQLKMATELVLTSKTGFHVRLEKRLQ